ncbi:hypothetical protein ABE41_018440 [Fictibacillus arsenicus]|uniref:Uncharacterized protein n=1 Tax=Fictibacillus arsenicus TaxID=255247 RepID=A0A1B1Z987_9BACL|nr:hypothetical protein ABE41_018440 [Fictibacillus arsenicus]
MTSVSFFIILEQDSCPRIAAAFAFLLFLLHDLDLLALQDIRARRAGRFAFKVMLFVFLFVFLFPGFLFLLELAVVEISTLITHINIHLSGILPISLNRDRLSLYSM